MQSKESGLMRLTKVGETVPLRKAQQRIMRGKRKGKGEIKKPGARRQ